MRRSQEWLFENFGGSLRQNTGTIVVDQKGRTRKKAKESMSTRRTRRVKGERIGLDLLPYGGRQQTLAKQLGQGMSGREQGTQNFQGDTLSEGHPTTRRMSIPRYGARSVLSPIMSHRAPKIGLRSLGALLSARTPLHRSSDLP